MRILLCHNRYQQLGGEDRSFDVEAEILESRGHQVLRYLAHNDDIKSMRSLQVARKTVWNREVYHDLRALIRREKPEVMHCTNTFPLISPAAYYAARDEGVAVAQSLRNYRLLCPNAQLLRDGAICERCVGKSVPWPSVWHACYRKSRMGSAVVAAMLAWHNHRKTWSEMVDLYYTLTHFARDKFIEGGLPAGKIVVKPNCLHPDPAPGTGGGGYVLYVGRLSREKGIAALLEAWSLLGDDVRLKVVGDGPMRADVEQAAARDRRIEMLGLREMTEVLQLVGEASLLVMPSIWYETFGRVIVEAYAKGTPVLVSRLGAMEELVDHHRTGALFRAGDAEDLVLQMKTLFELPTWPEQFRVDARREFESQYTSAQNCELLVAIYEKAIALHQEGCHRRLQTQRA